MNVQLSIVVIRFYGQAHESDNLLGFDCLADLYGMIMLLVVPHCEHATLHSYTSHDTDAYMSLVGACKSSGCFLCASSCVDKIELPVSACLNFSVSLVIICRRHR